MPQSPTVQWGWPGISLVTDCGVTISSKVCSGYTVLHQLSDQNYLITTPNRRKRNHLCHVNLLKPYDARVSSWVTLHQLLLQFWLLVQWCGQQLMGDDDSMLRGRLKNSESLRNFDVLLAHLLVEKPHWLKVTHLCMETLPQERIWLSVTRLVLQSQFGKGFIRFLKRNERYWMRKWNTCLTWSMKYMLCLKHFAPLGCIGQISSISLGCQWQISSILLS